MISERRSSLNLLVFELASRRFAIAASAVREVVALVAITPLPKAPPVVEGLVNYHGDIIPALDIRHRFGLPSAPLVPEHHLVIAAVGDRVAALRVDRATELLEIPLDSIDRSAHSITGVEYVDGVVALPDGLLVIHDLDRFLSLEEVAQLDGLLHEALDSPVASRPV